MNDFDSVACYYDHLAFLIFGGSVSNSQKALLHHVSLNDNVLILGGGAGKILHLLPMYKIIDYLDKSEKMIRRAKSHQAENVNFIQSDYLESASIDKQYDVIICPFFLDCFSETNLTFVLKKIKQQLKKNGKLIVTDFCYPRNHFMSRIMHLFFQLTVQLESRYLKNLPHAIESVGFREEESLFFHHNHIFSRLYRNL